MSANWQPIEWYWQINARYAVELCSMGWSLLYDGQDIGGGPETDKAQVEALVRQRIQAPIEEPKEPVKVHVKVGSQPEPKEPVNVYIKVLSTE